MTVKGKGKVAVFGGTGLIGRDLISFFLSEGFEISLFTRNISKAESVFKGRVTIYHLNEDLKNHLENHKIIINLAGENISKRWTASMRKRIRDSRVNTTSQIINSINMLNNKPEVYFQASAVGYYPSSNTESFNETSRKGSSFLSNVVNDWEAASEPIDPIIRKIIGRIGVVLSKEGGMLPNLILPIKLFLGGIPGKGNGWISWIHIDDLVRAILFLINKGGNSGIFNLCSPEPVTMKELISNCGEILKRPVLLRIPEFFIRLLFGKMGEETILSSQKVSPERLLKSDYDYKYSVIKNALNDQLS